MHLSEFAFLTDENIHPEMLKYLRSVNHDCKSVEEIGLNGVEDALILARAAAQKSVVITQDSDFGKLVYKDQSNFYGIVFLRPGHLHPEFHKRTWQILLAQNIDFLPPFMAVVEQDEGRIKIRLRNRISATL